MTGVIVTLFYTLGRSEREEPHIFQMKEFEEHYAVTKMWVLETQRTHRNLIPVFKEARI
jgi:hypothetical protein